MRAIWLPNSRSDVRRPTSEVRRPKPRGEDVSSSDTAFAGVSVRRPGAGRSRITFTRLLQVRDKFLTFGLNRIDTIRGEFLPRSGFSPMNSRTVEPNGNRNGHKSLVARITQPGKKRDRAAKQQALIRAATELFASRGYEATTTREIAARAGCAEGLIHRYFQSKSGLLFALMRFHASEEATELGEHLPRADELDQEIQQLLEWELDRMWKARDFLRVMVPRAILDPKVGRFVSKVGPGRHTKAIRERLRHYQRNAVFLEDSEVEALANAIGALGFTFGFMRQVVFGFDRKQTKDLAVKVAQIFSRGLRSPLDQLSSVAMAGLRRSQTSMDSNPPAGPPLAK